MTHLTADIVERRKANDDRRASERLGLKSTLQSAREKLTSSSGLDRAFEFETLRIFARSKISSCIMLAIYTGLIAASLAIWAPPMIVIIWCCTAISTLVLGALVAQRFQAGGEEVSVVAWHRRFVILEFFQSTMWCSVVIITLLPEGEFLRVFVMVAGKAGCFDANAALQTLVTQVRTPRPRGHHQMDFVALGRYA